jgi:hypothetical protein
MNKYVYVLVYSYDNKTISNYNFFNSEKEAMDWKRKQIKDKECYNPISSYTVIRLDGVSSLATHYNIDEYIESL